MTLEFRSDGTGTSRSQRQETSFAWTVSGNELLIFTATQNRINRYVFNRPTVCEEVAVITPDRIELRETRLGKVVRTEINRSPASGATSPNP